METTEGNKLIAEFMGASFKTQKIGENVRINTYWDNPPCYQGVNLENLKYHSSWDWLMPVVEKIENLITTIDEIGGGQVLIFNDCCKINPYKMDAPKGTLFEVKGNKKQSIWLACVEFIKWYNDQKK